MAILLGEVTFSGQINVIAKLQLIIFDLSKKLYNMLKLPDSSLLNV